jgi:hypothetical protein
MPLRSPDRVGAEQERIQSAAQSVPGVAVEATIVLATLMVIFHIYSSPFRKVLLCMPNKSFPS